VIDPDDYLIPGSFTLGTFGPTQPLFVVDDTLGRAFYVLNINGGFLLRAYDLVTYLPLGEVDLPGITSPTSIRRWGTNGLAITQSNGPITLIRSKLG
jgi:hypothetical protein